MSVPPLRSCPLPEYIITYGVAGYFDRFTAAEGASYERSDRVIIRSNRGVELGSVLCEATRGLQQFLNHRPPGELLRLATAEDDAALAGLQVESQKAFAEARRLARELEMAFEIVDVEFLLEPRTFIFHYLGKEEDPRPLVSRVSRDFDVYVELFNLAGQLPGKDEPVPEVCAECGSETGGNCGTTGGCGTDSQCGTAKKQMTPEEWRAYFAELRERMARGEVIE
jgi:PSP1-like protein